MIKFIRTFMLDVPLNVFMSKQGSRGCGVEFKRMEV